jgi:hypothetical protein
MRDIGEAARPIVSQMIFETKPVDLDPTEQMRVADWIYLRCLVLQAAADRASALSARAARTTPDRAQLPVHWYRDLAADHRTRSTCRIAISGLAPPNNDLRTALFRCSELDSWRDLPSDATPEGYHATFNIGHLVMSVFLFTHLAEGGRMFGLASHPGFGSMLTSIFPPSFKTVQWPATVLSSDQYSRLIETTPVAGVASRG